MTKEELIRNLKYTMEKHKNDKVDTFGTNISLMCKDVLDYLEQPTTKDCLVVEDCISREQALLTLTGENLSAKSALELIALFNKRIQSLPPVTPTHGTCKDCKKNKGLCLKFLKEVKDDFYCKDFERRE